MVFPKKLLLLYNETTSRVCSRSSDIDFFDNVTGILLGDRWVVFLFILVGRVFANDLGDQGSIPGCVIPKTLKMVLDTALLNTKVCIKSKVEQSRERSSTLPYTSV